MIKDKLLCKAIEWKFHHLTSNQINLSGTLLREIEDNKKFLFLLLLLFFCVCASFSLIYVCVCACVLCLNHQDFYNQLILRRGGLSEEGRWWKNGKSLAVIFYGCNLLWTNQFVGFQLRRGLIAFLNQINISFSLFSSLLFYFLFYFILNRYINLTCIFSYSRGSRFKIRCRMLYTYI